MKTALGALLQARGELMALSLEIGALRREIQSIREDLSPDYEVFEEDLLTEPYGDHIPFPLVRRLTWDDDGLTTREMR